ncbi:MAG: dihydroorotate dehydrogenase [Chthonomonadales bacterium]
MAGEHPLEPDLSVALGPLKLKNPVLTASGTFGFGEEWADFFDLGLLGGVTVKAVTVKPRAGNPMPRMVETAAGVLNSIGLQNPGLEMFLSEKLPYLRRFDTAIIVNIAGDALEDFAVLAERLDGVPGVSALEVNISCPNQACGGLEFGVDPNLTLQVISAVRKRTRLPLIAKLSPNVTDITVIARAAADGGADILSLVNTFVGTAINPATRRFRLANRTGGLSGPCIKPLALYMVWRVAQAVPLPIIGMGGICNASDAVEFLLAGAWAVAVGTVNFVNPKAPVEIVEGIRTYLREQGAQSVRDIIGTVR